MEMNWRGLPDFRRAIGVALLGMAAFQVWIARAIYIEHPILASFEAMMAGLLVIGVTLAW